MATGSFTKADAQLLADAISKSLPRNASSGAAPTKSIVDLKEAGNITKETLKDFSDTAKNSLNTFRDLSRTGSNFSNDLVGMSAAAARSRLDLDEFAQVVKDNGKYLTGMGGSVTRGTEAFAKLSDGFFKNNMDKELRNLGYSSKELNEVLAMQASIQKFTNAADEKSSADARNSAAEMAREMDMMAKLTGKSRQEQMEIMQKNRVDGQVEAKLRLMTMGKTEEEARKIRTDAMAALKQAEIEGRGQMAKELFATGTLISEEATNQFATFGKASQATADQMSALGKGQFDAAKQFGERATAEMLRNQQDPTLLLQATLGEAGGPIGKTMIKNIETMMPFNDSVQATAKSMNVLMTTQDDYAKVLKAARVEIEKSRSGLDKQGGFVGGTVAGATAVERTVQDIRAGVAGAVMTRNQKGESISQEASRAGQYAVEGAERLAGGKEGNVQSIIEGRARQGLMSQGQQGGPIGGVTNAALNVATKAVNVTGDTFVSISGKINSMAVGGRSSGSLGATGKLIEDFGEGTLSILHGREGVVTEEQMKNLALGMQQSGATAVADKFAQAKQELSNMDTQKMFSNMIDTEFGDLEGAMAKVTQDIDTEFGDLAGAMKRVADDMPDTEFGDLEGAMAKVTQDIDTEFGDLAGAMKRVSEDSADTEFGDLEGAMARVSQDIDTEFGNLGAADEIPADAFGDFEDVLAKVVQDIDTEFGNLGSADEIPADAFGDFEDTMAKVVQDIDNEFGNLEGSITQQSVDPQSFDPNELLRGISSTIDTTISSKPSTPAVDLNSINLPGFGQAIKNNAATVPAAVRAQSQQNQPSQQTTAGQAQASKPTTQTASAGSQNNASLDDVVKSLDQLNMRMERLISQNEDLGRKQISATKSNSSNIYDRM